MMIVGTMTFLYDKNRDTTSKYLLYGGLALIAIFPIFDSRYFFVPAAMLLIAKANIMLLGHKTLHYIGIHTFEIFIAHHFALMSIGLFDNYFITISIFFVITIILAFLFYYIQKYSVLLIKKVT